MPLIRELRENEDMMSDKEQMDMVKTIEQGILDVFHKICEENHLKYSLAYGTLIGAVRHKGFIPWDDDIDIMMPREDYERLLLIWDTVAPEGYLLQEYKKDLDYINNFAKIRKDHTTFLQFEMERNRKYHKGIFIDIFPFDNVAKGEISKKIQYIACAVNLLYSRGFPSGESGLIGVIEKILLKAPNKIYPKLREAAEKIIKRWNNRKSGQIFSPVTIQSCKVYYPAETFQTLILMEFNGKKYHAISLYDECLKLEYGDYMKLPSKEERVWKHRPILVNLEHNYEELA